MKLSDWLWQNRLTQKQFAETLGYSRNYINMICNRKVVPGPPIRRMIIKITNGKVTEEEMMERK